MHLPSRECDKNRSRVNESGRAFAGSQRQIQTFVNDHPFELSDAVSRCLSLDPAIVKIEWVSPLKVLGYMEYRDGDFLRALGMERLTTALREFWPSGGPCWDALGKIILNEGRLGCILIEAKSHVNEIYGNGCGASGASLQQIQGALNRTKKWIGVVSDADWTGKLYQSANRYAHLYFLRVIGGIDAYLVNVYFIADPRSPTSIQDWEPCN